MGEVVTLNMKAKNVLIPLTCMLQSISLMNKFKSPMDFQEQRAFCGNVTKVLDHVKQQIVLFYRQFKGKITSVNIGLLSLDD